MGIARMLVPVALEKRDETLLAFACGLACQGVRELLVAHVVDGTGQEAPVIIAEVERAREQLLGMIEPFRDCDMRIEARVVTGQVYREIMAIANQRGVDVICCGTEGKSFLDYLFSGSVSEDIALKGNERTMSVRYSLLNSTEDPADAACRFAQRLVVPTDFSGSSMRAVLSAYERPHDAIGTVHLLHVLSDGQSRHDAEAQMRGLVSLAEDYDVSVEVHLREGNPGDVVLDFVNEIDATGVITGRTGRSRLERGLLGSTSMRLLQEAPCPVVIQP